MNQDTAQKPIKAEKKEIDEAFDRLQEEISRTGYLSVSFKNTLSHEVEEDSKKPQPDYNNTITGVLLYLSSRLAEHNNQMERIVERLESIMGEVKVV